MATDSSILAGKTPWPEELVGHSPWGREEPATTEVPEHARRQVCLSSLSSRPPITLAFQATDFAVLSPVSALSR